MAWWCATSTSPGASASSTGCVEINQSMAWGALTLISTQVNNNLVKVVRGVPQRQTGSLGRQELDRRAEARRQEEVQSGAAATAHDQETRARVFANVARAHGLKPITHPRTVQGPLPDDALGSINDAFWGGISPEARQLARSYAEITKKK